MSIYLPPGVSPGPSYGTDQWHDFRRGLVTASRFGDVMTAPRSKQVLPGVLGLTARSYLMELVAATITGQDKVGGKSAAMERGIDLEADAIERYEADRFLVTGVTPGRILRFDDTIIAATPDGFVEDDNEGPGLIEVKCPEAKRHLETFMDKMLPDDYVEQVQGQLWVAGRQWCDFVSYDDRFPYPMQLVIIRVQRDEDLIEKMAEKVHAFADMVQQRVDDVRAFLASATQDEAMVLVNDLLDLTNQPFE